jgi:hypothetical protein
MLKAFEPSHADLREAVARHVFSKLGITSRVELARLARDYGMA